MFTHSWALFKSQICNLFKLDDPNLDKIKGCLVGGAIGDALGYPIEFIDSYKAICNIYGEKGLTRYDKSFWWLSEKERENEDVRYAVFTDDTQMTLYTACGLINAIHADVDPLESISQAYKEWYYTQVNEKCPFPSRIWLSCLPEMNKRRAPGSTCLTSLSEMIIHHKPHNNSKGCGGLMRIAPIAILSLVTDKYGGITELEKLAAESSKLTHLHPLGYIPSAFVVYIISRLLQLKNPTKADYRGIILDGLKEIETLYADYSDDVQILNTLIHKSLRLAEEDREDAYVIEKDLGGGWVAEETAAIAIYVTLKYFNQFDRTIVASVNHAGDSDSTGAIAGNIMGAVTGYKGLPSMYLKDLQLKDVILKVSEDLYHCIK